MTETQRWQDAISLVVHELKSPTASLNTMLQVLERRMDNPDFDPGKSKEYVQMSLKQTERLTVLINDLLDAARMGRGQLTHQFTEVSIAPLVADIINRLAAGNHSHRFKLGLEGSAIVRADPARLEQALVNIVVNAMKYSPAGSTVTITTQATDRFTITVSDEGIGITREQQEQLFDLYYRAPSAQGVKGLGLGLPLAHGIIKAHGGELQVRSEVGKGSAFIISLPMRDHSDRESLPVG